MSYYDDDDYENYDSQFVADLDTSSLGYDDEYRDDYGGELGGEDDYVYEEELGDLNLQSSFSDLSRTSSQSNLLQTKYKYFVIVFLPLSPSFLNWISGEYICVIICMIIEADI